MAKSTRITQTQYQDTCTNNASFVDIPQARMACYGSAVMIPS